MEMFGFSVLSVTIIVVLVLICLVLYFLYRSEGKRADKNFDRARTFEGMSCDVLNAISDDDISKLHYYRSNDFTNELYRDKEMHIKRLIELVNYGYFLEMINCLYDSNFNLGLLRKRYSDTPEGFENFISDLKDSCSDGRIPRDELSAMVNIPWDKIEDHYKELEASYSEKMFQEIQKAKEVWSAEQ